MDLQPAAPAGRTGLFLTFEGIDGAGKTSQLAWVPARLRALGVECIETREPGGTPAGEALRALLLTQQMQPDTEALLAFAARAEHVADVIRPALAAGRWVVCDRFSDATFAYQGGGRGLPVDRLAVLERWVHPGLSPDRTFLFDLPADAAARRRAAAREADRFEREDVDFFERVRTAYHQRVAADPRRFLTLDAARPFEATRSQLEREIDALVAGWRAQPNASAAGSIDGEARGG